MEALRVDRIAALGDSHCTTLNRLKLVMLITELLATGDGSKPWDHSLQSKVNAIALTHPCVICFFSVFYFSAHQERSLWPLSSASAATRSQQCTQDMQTVVSAHTRCHHVSLW